jgi:hypothetical protein
VSDHLSNLAVTQQGEQVFLDVPDNVVADVKYFKQRFG